MNINETTVVYGTEPNNASKKDIKQIGYVKRQGLAFPFIASSNHGYFVKQAGNALLKSCIKQLIYTEHGERLMMPMFGCGLKKFIGEPNDEFLREEIRSNILFNFSRYLPMISVVDINISEVGSSLYESNTLLIKLFLKIKDNSDTTIEVEVEL